MALVRASIRDWPTVPWRGRPQTRIQNYLRPGDFDCYLDSRINFVDLRSGIYAFEPGEDLDEPLMRRIINECHRLGLVVYGTVNCGVAKMKYPSALKTFTEMLRLL